ncbi:RrF2 family transcriptional regulator [Desulfitobacterium metallireducens]|uniref:Rrf2 family transcriptional regulator n=1 Tax=Desulfitobacterium metallireducens DSM 15288 TaxID=871968 RepID=W0ECK3_9FIRM|nr:Rrf2 family transcriptional regulator [Desulfitobacterium metallireducens]AHF06791.1 Rrf2 family transcriptional regulator [Desulfitobacterium metallireducens DSM 15288]
MKISTKGRYGLRALLDLAVNSDGEHVALSNIAERQGISENYLEQVFSSLRKAGIIKSVKGAQGGYILAEKPNNIRVGRILRVLEGDLSVVQDDDDHPHDYYESIQYCLQLQVWDKMSESINNFVDSITLEDLVQDYKVLNNEIGDMYYI